MKKLLTTTLATAAVILASGYVSSTPTTQAEARPAPATATHLDAHVGYYEQHLSRLGLTQRAR